MQSFPEYLSRITPRNLVRWFGLANIILPAPVALWLLLFAAVDGKNLEDRWGRDPWETMGLSLVTVALLMIVGFICYFFAREVGRRKQPVADDYAPDEELAKSIRNPIP